MQTVLRLFEGILILFIVNEIKFSLHKLSWVLVISAMIQGAIASFQFFFQEIWASTLLGVSHKLPQMLGISVIETEAGRFLRAYGTFSHPNVLAVFLVIGLVLALGLVLTHRRKFEMIILAFCIVIISSGLFFAFSRSAFLALLISVMIVAIYVVMNKTNGTYKLLLQFIGLVMAPIILLCIMNSSIVFSRYVSRTIIDSASVTERVSLFKEARGLVEKHWLKGVGIGNYTLAAYNLDGSKAGQAYQPVHNVLLLSLVETGLLGALFLVLLMIEVIRIIIGFKVTYDDGILAEMAQFGGGELFKEDYGFNTYWYVCLSGLVIGLTVWFFFDHFFWTLYTGVILWWLVLAIWVRMLIKLKT